MVGGGDQVPKSRIILLGFNKNLGDQGNLPCVGPHELKDSIALNDVMKNKL